MESGLEFGSGSSSSTKLDRILKRRKKEMKGLTQQQLTWALQHDWALNGCMDSEGNIGVDVRNDDPVFFDEPLRFFNFQELKAWAGY